MAAILKTCHTYYFYFIFIGFLDPENIEVDTKIVFLSELEAKILPKRQFNDCRVAILFGLYEKFLKDAKLASA